MIPWIVAGALASLFAAGCQARRRDIPEGFPEADDEPPFVQLSPDPPPAPCPGEMTPVRGFCVDRYEAHLLAADRIHPHYLPPPQAGYRAASSAGVFPQAHVSREEAEAACDRAEKRLCTLNEWLLACRGLRGSVYPYGNREAQGYCNSRKPHLPSLLFEGSPATWKYEAHFNNPRLNQTPGFLEKTGFHDRCTNEYGVFDMVGNLHEWVADAVDPRLEGKFRPTEAVRRKIKDNYGNGIFMGGFYSTGVEHGMGCGFITIGHEPAYRDYSTGFRCCKDFEARPEEGG